MKFVGALVQIVHQIQKRYLGVAQFLGPLRHTLFQFCIEPPDRFSIVLLFGEILDDDDKPGDHIIFHEKCCRELTGKSLPVFPLQDRFEPGKILSLLHRIQENAAAAEISVLVRVKHQTISPQDFLFAISKHMDGGVIQIFDNPLWICDHEDRIHQRIVQSLQVSIVLLQRFLCPFARGNIIKTGQNVLFIIDADDLRRKKSREPLSRFPAELEFPITHHALFG